MDPLHETKVGLWNNSHVVLIGRCQRTGSHWRVYRDTTEDVVYVEVAASDVLGDPRDPDYPPSGYDGQDVQILRVRAGAAATARIHSKTWSGKLKIKGQTGITLTQQPEGGTVCVSNLLFEIRRPHLASSKPRLIGLCFGKWNLETTPPRP